jgi:hypothetical protein
VDFLAEHVGMLAQLLSWLAVVCLAKLVAHVATGVGAGVAVVTTSDSRRSIAKSTPADVAPGRDADRLVTTWLARCLARRDGESALPSRRPAARVAGENHRT